MSASSSSARNLREAILGSLLTPTGLFCCLVALLIATCPGARGDGDRDSGTWLSEGAITPAGRVNVMGGSHAWGDATVDVGPAARMAAFDKSLAESDTPLVKFARSAGPDERRSDDAADADVMGHSKVALPLLVDPLLTTAAAPRPTPRPLTGPAVGVVPRPRFGMAPVAPASAPAKQTPFSSLRGSSNR